MAEAESCELCKRTPKDRGLGSNPIGTRAVASFPATYKAGLLARRQNFHIFWKQTLV